MITSVYDNKKLIIEKFPLDNQRKVMKFKIFLNSNKSISYDVTNDSIEILFNLNDELIIAQEVSKIVSFLEKTFDIKIELSNNISNRISENNNSREELFSAIDRLNKLKSGSIVEDTHFKEYCKMCDDTLVCKLRQYQYSASFYLTIGKGGFDFSVPGSGKTIITYATYNYFKRNNICDSVLIIGPISAYNAWFDEYYTCFGKNPDFESLTNISKNDSISYLLSSPNNQKEITFINIDKAWRLQKQIASFLSYKKALLIVDEAHKEKNPEAQITKAVMEIAKYAKCRIILTGTPMPNGYEDLFSLMNIYSPYNRILPYSYGDLKRFSINGASEKEQQRIMDSIKPLYSRISKKFLIESGELLKANFNNIHCVMSSEQKEIYDFLNKLSFEIDDDLESSINVGLMKAVIIRKMQVSANPGLLTKSIISSIDEYRNEYATEFEIDESDSEAIIKADAEIKRRIANSNLLKTISKFECGSLQTPKNEAAVELAISLIEKGNKVILWDIFVQNMYCIKELIEKRYNGKIEIINGMVSGENRLSAIKNFKNGDSMVLIANPSTLAESISLHRCCQFAIYVNRNYNAAQFIQSKDRIHRINMPLGKTATYYFLLNEETIDDAVNNRLALKENRMLKILDSDNVEIGGNEFENTSFMSLDDVINSYKK